jgi:hypothetical protein
MRAASVDEIDFERKVAAEAPDQRPRMPMPEVISDLTAVGATHITGRRLSEVLCRSLLDELSASGNQPTDGIWSKEDLIRIAGSIEG